MMGKHLSIICAAAVVFGAASCQKANINDASVAADAALRSITVRMPGNGTRLGLDEATNYTVFEVGDEVFGWDASGSYTYSCTSVDADKAEFELISDYAPSSMAGTKVNLVYANGYDAEDVEGGSLSLDIKNQNATAFSQLPFVMTAQGIVAEDGGCEVTFSNETSYIRIKDCPTPAAGGMSFYSVEATNLYPQMTLTIGADGNFVRTVGAAATIKNSAEIISDQDGKISGCMVTFPAPEEAAQANILISAKSVEGFVYYYNAGKKTVPANKIINVSEKVFVTSPSLNGPALKTADVLADYPFYEFLPAGKQDFIYGHILTSYANRQWFRQDITYILMGEAPLKEEYLIENVGNTNPAWYTSHGSDSYFHIMSMTPGAKVKACAGEWKYAEDYINSHPDERLMFSCALDCLGGDDFESLVSDPNYYSLKNILTNPNCVFSISGGNVKTIQYILEENQPIVPYGQYMSASVSSNLNNKITVCGYYPGRDNIFGVNEDSRRPIGFGRDKVNIVIPFTPLVSSNGLEYSNTNSSYPAGALSSALGNYLSILLYNNPGWTLNDAMTLMLEKYLYEEPLKYLNDAGQVVDGDNWNFFRCIEFLEDQTLHKDAFNALQLSGATVQLPSYKGVIYTGQGVQFEYNGEYYDAVEGNEALIAAALVAGNGVISQRWSRELWLNMGGSGSVQLEARLVNSSCEIIPDLKLSRSVAVN